MPLRLALDHMSVESVCTQAWIHHSKDFCVCICVCVCVSVGGGLAVTWISTQAECTCCSQVCCRSNRVSECKREIVNKKFKQNTKKSTFPCLWRSDRGLTGLGLQVHMFSNNILANVLSNEYISSTALLMKANQNWYWREIYFFCSSYSSHNASHAKCFYFKQTVTWSSCLWNGFNNWVGTWLFTLMLRHTVSLIAEVILRVGKTEASRWTRSPRITILLQRHPQHICVYNAQHDALSGVWWLKGQGREWRVYYVEVERHTVHAYVCRQGQGCVSVTGVARCVTFDAQTEFLLFCLIFFSIMQLVGGAVADVSKLHDVVVLLKCQRLQDVWNKEILQPSKKNESRTKGGFSNLPVYHQNMLAASSNLATVCQFISLMTVLRRSTSTFTDMKQPETCSNFWKKKKSLWTEKKPMVITITLYLSKHLVVHPSQRWLNWWILDTLPLWAWRLFPVNSHCQMWY